MNSSLSIAPNNTIKTANYILPGAITVYHIKDQSKLKKQPALQFSKVQAAFLNCQPPRRRHFSRATPVQRPYWPMRRHVRFPRGRHGL